MNRNSNQSVDVGMGQHNSMHFAELARYGIAPKDLFDPCIATYVAAWHLARNIKKFGNTWFGIAAYHSATPCFNLRYQGLVWNKLVNWGAVQGSTIPVSQLKDCRLAKGPTNSQSTSQQTASMVVYDNASN